MTGCDTTSPFSGIGKRSSWKVFKQSPELLHSIGVEDVPNPTALADAEEFVCKLYQPTTTNTSIHTVRSSLFRKNKANIDSLPPTKDFLTLHLKMAHYQTRIWKHCLVPNPQLPSLLDWLANGR